MTKHTAARRRAATATRAKAAPRRPPSAAPPAANAPTLPPPSGVHAVDADEPIPYRPTAGNAPAPVPTVPPPSAVRRRRPEEAAIGEFDPHPAFDELQHASTATLLVEALTSRGGDELLSSGLEQLASELAVLGCYLASETAFLRGGILHDVIHGYEGRLRVLAAIARKTLRAAAEERAA